MFKHNDFEILKLALENDPDALKLMFDKYTPLIYKMVHKFNLTYDFDDYVQEGYLVLYNSILKYDPNNKSSKSFTRFFELNLHRKYVSIVSKRCRRQEIFSDNVNYIYEQSVQDEEDKDLREYFLKEMKKILTKREFLVYTLREFENYSVQYISDKLDITEKVVYNTVYRAKGKIKEHFSNKLDKDSYFC